MSQTLLETRGVIQEINVSGRELKVAVPEGVSQLFDVSPECTIFLRDEPVKLRLLQACDRAKILYAQKGETRIACIIRVD